MSPKHPRYIRTNNKLPGARRSDKMGLLQEEKQILEELIRSVIDKIDPVDKYSYLYHKNIVQGLYGKRPACFVSLCRKDGGRMGQPLIPYILPICNRMGHTDPDIINFSIKMVKKLMRDKADQFDVNDLNSALSKLQHHHDRYSKEVPVSHKMAGHKANVTRMFNNIGKHLNKKI